jgi:hypothetical protein
MSSAPLRRTPRVVRLVLPFVALGTLGLAAATVANVVPNEIQMPGTQPLEASSLEASYNCEPCHGQYDPAVEPFENWAGSMMAHAGRDPLFWAGLAIAERGFDGSGDTCLRCHLPVGWYDGRSTPTDGSAMQYDDFDGVTCDLCHNLTDPDNSEHIGIQNPPFVANDGGMPATAYRGNGEAVLLSTGEKLGPYSNPNAFHPFRQSLLHRRSDLCGTCHDVSNPLTGDLAPNNGAMTPLAPGTFDGTLGGPLVNKAALNNFPHAYGVIERTFSEHKSSPYSTMPVADYKKLPAALKQGALREAHNLAFISDPTGNYNDGAVRNFTCQSCHMPPVTGQGCGIFGTSTRNDLPLHDLTGANYWAPDAILYLEAQNRLFGGNGLTPWQLSGIQSGKLRALDHLQDAAALTVSGNTLTVFNLTGHKLISGYAEGRRMWLNVRWYDALNVLVREDGEYGQLPTVINSVPTLVDTILDINDPETHIYEAQPAISQDWAAKLLTMGVPSSLPLRPRHRRGDQDARPARRAGAGHERGHLPLRAQQRDRGRQPHPAVQDALRRRGRAQRATGARDAVRQSVERRRLQPLGRRRAASADRRRARGHPAHVPTDELGIHPVPRPREQRLRAVPRERGQRRARGVAEHEHGRAGGDGQGALGLDRAGDVLHGQDQ